METEGKKLLSWENQCLYETFKISKRIKKVSFQDLAEALGCTELEAARVQKYPVFSPCYRLIKLAETLGKNAIFETQLVLSQAQSKANIRRIKEKYQKLFEEWAKTNIVPIRDFSIDEISKMEGLTAAAFDFGLELEAALVRKRTKKDCVILEYKPRERSTNLTSERAGEVIEVKFSEMELP